MRRIANLDGKAYPSHKSERNGKDRLYNKIVNYLILKQATFEYKERKEMKAVPNALLNVLWIIDAHMGEISADTGNYNHQISNLYFTNLWLYFQTSLHFLMDFALVKDLPVVNSPLFLLNCTKVCET